LNAGQNLSSAGLGTGQNLANVALGGGQTIANLYGNTGQALANAATGTAAMAGNAAMQAGAANASGQVGAANAWGGALGNLGNYFMLNSLLNPTGNAAASAYNPAVGAMPATGGANPFMFPTGFGSTGSLTSYTWPSMPGF
jgi:hypothetical protein